MLPARLHAEKRGHGTTRTVRNERAEPPPRHRAEKGRFSAPAMNGEAVAGLGVPLRGSERASKVLGAVQPPNTRGVGGVVGTHRAAPSPPCRAPCTMLAVMGQQGWDLPRALVPPLCALGVRVPTSAPCTLVQTRAHPYGHCACAACCCTCTLQATRCWGPCTCCVSHRCDVTHTRGLGVNTTPPTSPRGGGGLRGSHEPP